MFLVLLKRVFQASRDEEFIQENWRGDTETRAPRGGNEYYRFWKHRRKCETPVPEPAREDAEQRSVGIQRGHPTECEI